jgi:hypothetical protein
MHIRITPRTADKPFAHERKTGGVGGRGRATAGYSAVGTIMGTLADASETTREQYRQLQHPVSHTIVSDGSPAAKEGDRLVLGGNRYFYIQGIENPGGFNIKTLYQCEERQDKAGTEGA